MRVLAFLRVVPVGTQTASMSSYVAEALKIIGSAGLKHELTPFGTAIEANSVSEVVGVVEKIVDRLSVLGVPRLLVDISLDLRFDKSITLEYKVRSVQEKLREVVSEACSREGGL